MTRRPISSRVVAAGLVAVALFAGIALTRAGHDKPYRVRAEFKDVEGIRKNFWVRIAGTRVGEVEKVTVTPRDTAMVTIKLDRAAAPLGAGASAQVRPANLLGEKYIQLTRGDARRPMADDATIPVTRTGVAVELDDIFNTLDAGVRARLRILVNEIGIALAGHGANFNQLLTELPDTIQGARGVVAELAAENRKLGELVDSADAAVKPIDARRADVGALVDRTTEVLDVTARRRQALAATVRTAPAALRQITSTLDRLNRTAVKLEPAAPLLRRSAPELASTLRALPAFAASLHEPLTTARRVAPSLTRLGVQGDTALRRLRPTLRTLDGFTTSIRPLVYTLGRAGAMDGVLGILNNWSKAASYKDGISHYFDFHASISPELLESAVDRLSLTKSAPAPARRGRPDRRPTTSVPGLPKLDPHHLLPKTVLPGGIRVPELPPAVGQATSGVQDLLDYLLKP